MSFPSVVFKKKDDCVNLVPTTSSSGQTVDDSNGNGLEMLAVARTDTTTTTTTNTIDNDLLDNGYMSWPSRIVNRLANSQWMQSVAKRKKLVVVFCVCQLLLLLLALVVVVAVRSSIECTDCVKKMNNNHLECQAPFADIVSKANFSANPCVDFFEFACGNFRAPHLISVPIYTVEDQFSENELHSVWKTLSEKQSHSAVDPSKVRYYDNVKELLKSCLYSQENGQIFYKSLVAEIDKLKSLMDSILHYKNRPYQAIIVRVWKIYGINLFFKFDLTEDIYDEKMIVVNPVPSEELLNINDLMFFKETTEILSFFNLTSICSDGNTNHELCLLQMFHDAVTILSGLKSMNWKTYQETEAIDNQTENNTDSEQVVDWDELIISMVGKKYNYSRPVFTELVAFIEDISESVFKNYVFWRLIHNFVIEFNVEVYGGKQWLILEEKCLGALNKFLPNVARVITSSTNTLSINLLKKYFLKINEQNIAPNITLIESDQLMGFDDLTLYSELKDSLEYNEKLGLSTSYLDNIKNLKLQIAFDQLRQSHLIGEFQYFSAISNRRSVLLRLSPNIAQSHLFSAGNPIHLNIPLLISRFYSAIIQIVTLNHNNHKYATPRNILLSELFDGCANTIFAQYSKMPNHPAYLNDNRPRLNITRKLESLNEAIAERLALAWSYQVWKSIRSAENVEDISETIPLPRNKFFNVTEDQLFFLAFAQSRCSHRAPEPFADEQPADQTSPRRYLINRLMQYNADAVAAFHCSAPSQPQCTTPSVNPVLDSIDVKLVV